MTARYNVFLPLADTSELSNRVVTVNGVENTVSPSAFFYRTDSIAFKTPVTITYHNVYTDGSKSEESPLIKVIAGEDLPSSNSSFFAKLYTGDAPVVNEVVLEEVMPPTPPPVVPVVDTEPKPEVTPPASQ